MSDDILFTYSLFVRFIVPDLIDNKGIDISNATIEIDKYGFSEFIDSLPTLPFINKSQWENTGVIPGTFFTFIAIVRAKDVWKGSIRVRDGKQTVFVEYNPSQTIEDLWCRFLQDKYGFIETAKFYE